MIVVRMMVLGIPTIALQRAGMSQHVCHAQDGHDPEGPRGEHNCGAVPTHTPIIDERTDAGQPPPRNTAVMMRRISGPLGESSERAPKLGLDSTPFTFRSAGQVKTIQVHHFAPDRDEVMDEPLLAVSAGIDFRDGAKL